MLRAINSQLSKKEQRSRVRRSLMGKRSKAKRDQILGSAGCPRFGFRYVRNERGKAVGYAVEPKSMAGIRRVLSMLADSDSLHEVQRTLEGERVRPQRRQAWEPHDHQEHRHRRHLPPAQRRAGCRPSERGGRGEARSR